MKILVKDRPVRLSKRGDEQVITLDKGTHSLSKDEQKKYQNELDYFKGIGAIEMDLNEVMPKKQEEVLEAPKKEEPKEILEQPEKEVLEAPKKKASKKKAKNKKK